MQTKSQGIKQDRMSLFFFLCRWIYFLLRLQDYLSVFNRPIWYFFSTNNFFIRSNILRIFSTPITLPLKVHLQWSSRTCCLDNDCWLLLLRLTLYTPLFQIKEEFKHCVASRANQSEHSKAAIDPLLTPRTISCWRDILCPPETKLVLSLRAPNSSDIPRRNDTTPSLSKMTREEPLLAPTKRREKDNFLSGVLK